jgi:hypothetical protein
MKKKIKLMIGDIVRIRIRDDLFAFARVLNEPLMAFYDFFGNLEYGDNSVIKSPVLFKIWVMNDAISSGRWEVIGNKPLEADLLVVPDFFKVDPINKSLSIYRNGIDIPATVAQCEGLERAAVWSATHVESRLRDYFDGIPNKWTSSLNVVSDA